LLVPAFDAVHLRRRAQRSVEGIRPSVIAALQRRAFARALRDRPRAMTADVRERAHFAVIAADDQQWLTGDTGREELPALSKLIVVADELPRLREDHSILLADHRGIVVVARGNR